MADYDWSDPISPREARRRDAENRYDRWLDFEPTINEGWAILGIGGLICNYCGSMVSTLPGHKNQHRARCYDPSPAPRPVSRDEIEEFELDVPYSERQAKNKRTIY